MKSVIKNKYNITKETPWQKRKKDDNVILTIDDRKFFAWQDEIDAEILKQWQAAHPSYNPEDDEQFNRMMALEQGELVPSQLQVKCLYDLDIEEDASWQTIKNGQIFPSDIAPWEAIKDFNETIPYNLIPGYLHTHIIPRGFKIELVTIEKFFAMRRRASYTSEKIDSELPLIFSELELDEYRKTQN